MVHFVYCGVKGYNFQNKYCIFFSEDRFFFKQTVQTLMKCRILRHFIWVFTVCKSIHIDQGFKLTKG